MISHLILPIAQATADESATNTVNEANQATEQFIESLVSFATRYGMSVLGAIVILIVGNILAKFISKRISGLILKKHPEEPSLASIAKQVLYAALMVVVVIIVLGKFGVETASLIAVLGTAGLAIGLALQGTLSNIAAGVMILFLKPFRAGNAVKIGGGDVYLVDEIGLFVTKAHQPDCPRVMIPNSKIWGSIIVNFSDTVDSQRRFDITFGIAYGDDINRAIQILEELAASDERVLKDPAPFIKVDSLGDSSVNIMFRVYCMASDWWPAKLDLTKAGKEALEAGGCSIPFPQRDVHFFKEGSEAAG
ncbi:mechanosensitive ion channel domain-containing protein [Pelagicoccus sp. SDUM812002]|uniref:mechanosensitive ion channel family protein n=1 Tax=Pelagicoccus sp. SDUM812002 TaxID=3041266 RepID=UPI00280CE9A6|nr:mechanosensitive ion channel domain-containing protein [Pelagicoccus sp. SDUM812002]MDQ8187741.1 mechanosensitive ion channel [Pelagicoccus sp. SDUM812002]